MRPSDFEVILWDFDGVIIESNTIREFGFREVLKEFDPAHVEQLIDFHNANGGWSRYVKFRYFYEEILGRSVSEELIQELSIRFSCIMIEKLSNTDYLIEDTLRFIENMYSNGKEMHIVSGSDVGELKKLCAHLKLSDYFLSINGSPTSKVELVKNIVQSKGYSKDDFCLIGDSVNDYEASLRNSITFFGYNNLDLKGLDEYIDHLL